AQAIATSPEAKAEFIEQAIRESDVTSPYLLQALREKLESIEDAKQLVEKMMAGFYVRDLELPKGLKTLALLEGGETSPVSLVMKPLPAAYFTRDPMASVGHGVLTNRMYWPQRNREVILYQMIFKHHPDYAGTPMLYDHDSPWHVEGGDVLNINAKTLAIGISERTEAAAIDQLAQNLFWGDSSSEIEQIFAIKIPHGYAYMHLDTVFTQVDYDKFTVYPGIFDTLRVYRLTKGDAQGEVGVEEIEDTLEHILERATGQDSVQLIECGGGDPIEASREQWNDGSNTLALAPGVACVYERNVVTNDALYKAGVELVVVPSEELSRGRGGPRCMSMPFCREEI
ncbi:arginine deiminase family protein, partial [Enorma sp.]